MSGSPSSFFGTTHRRRGGPLLLGGVLVSLVSGCGEQGALVAEAEPTVPAAEVEALSAGLGVLDSVFTSQAWRSLREAGSSLTSSGSVLSGAWGPAASIPAAAGTASGWAGAAAGPGQAVPAVPPHLLGRTVVFDSQLGRYVEDPNRLGAPGNGVRIVIYQPNTSASTELGWLDVRDAAPGSPNVWQTSVHGVVQGATFADYVVSVGGPAGPGLLRPTYIRLGGKVIAGNDVLKFDIDSDVPDPFNPTLDVDWTFTLQSLGLDINAAVSGVPITGQGVENLVITVIFHGFRWNINFNRNASVVNAQITVNGNEFATATGVISGPTVVGPGGQGISTLGRFLVLRFLLVADGVFETYNDLFTPPGAVIFLGL